MTKQSRTTKLLLLAATVCLAAFLITAAAQPQKLMIINGPVVESAQPGNTVIAWTTNSGGSTIVRYGTNPSNLTQTAQSPYKEGAGYQTHRVHITGLQPGTQYYYQIYSGQGEGTGTEATGQVNSFVTTGNGAASPQAMPRVAIYRLYSPNVGHFYTSSQQEAQGVGSSGGLKMEGTTGYLLSEAATGTVPFFRVLLPGGQHFYTTDASERDGAVSNNGGRYEGIVGYIATSQQPGTTPLYRLYNTQNRDHFYTTDASEKTGALQQGYKDEGVAGYIWRSQQ